MRYVLFSLSAFVLYAIFYFARFNGLNELVGRAVASGKLPGTDASIRVQFTGLKPIDHLLAVLTAFFYPFVDGQSPAILLHGIGFSGTFGAAWTLVVLESWRRGNAGTVAAYPAIFGLLAQLLTFAFATPLFLGLHLGCSVTARRPSVENIQAPRVVLVVLPVIFLVGYMVPTLAMVLPAPSMISIDMKQLAIVIWQPWPVYVSILTTAAYYVLFPFFPKSHRASMSSLRWVYASAFASAVVPHLITLVVSIASVVAPAIFNQHYVNELHPAKVYVLPFPWSGIKVQTVAEGVHYFLRWDYLIGSVGVLLWAVALYTVAHKQILSTFSVLMLVVKVALSTVIAGPVGAAIELMWERDELVFKETSSAGTSSRSVATKKYI
ncbi:hypothetical protein POX_c04044 [Penicillium oxalicum]|uniref:hypothetical protein n=1 Tax=Penicillium oxalicum TaxID=69781 RepID=UPI0020B78CD3|nr:hypothetical protein POX_c04044 [Penicillium oxalicum]KAI2791188.1 hypothetical protein POX_c04044 [Penicillium oxalicum]